MRALADRFPSLAKHGQVLRESWRTQNEADKQYIARDEHEFLPAALEIMEKPPSPGMRWLLLLTCLFFALALAWAILGKIDIVATANGKTIPGGNVKIVQPIEVGAIRALHVANGQFVRRGDLLIELDPTLASADAAQSAQSLLSAQITEARNSALLAHLRGGSTKFMAPEGAPADVVETQQALIDNSIAHYDAQAESLRQQRAENEALLAGANAEISKLTDALPFMTKQMSARAELAEKGFFSKLKLLEYEQMRAEHLRSLEVQRANAARAQASIEKLNAELRALNAGFGKAAATDLSDAKERVGMAGEELRKAERRIQYQELRAPVDGVVQQLAVTTVGGVVQPAQQLMVIVPCTSGDAANAASCNGGISVEAFVQNKDIGFIRVGQRVAVKLEAFNFTDYGLIEGVVANISRDAIDQSQRPAGSIRDEDGRSTQPGLVYAAKIELSCAKDDSARHPLCSQIQPGMSVQAEIKTGQRQIIQYLLSPISRSVNEAGRER